MYKIIKTSQRDVFINGLSSREESLGGRSHNIYYIIKYYKFVNRNMNTIQNCVAKKIKDSRGVETLEVEITAGDFSASASAPSGKSCGSKEAVVVSAEKAVKNVNEIIGPRLIGKEVNVFEIDKILLELDGTENKSNLGANALLVVSVAILKLEAKINNQPLWRYIQTLGTRSAKGCGDNFVGFPRLFANVLNGGAHGNFNLPFQEYILVLGDGSTIVEPFNQLQILFEKLGELLREKYGEIALGDEGGYSPKISQIEEPFEILSGLHNKLALDVAGGEFFKNGKYNVLDQKYSSDELSRIYKNLIEKFPIVSLEDPFAENDFDAFASLTQKVEYKNWIALQARKDGRFATVVSASCNEVAQSILVVGDDLTATNPRLIAKAATEKLVNAVIIKPNQIGTISETLEAVAVAKKAGLKIIVSHRSGETMDSFIADLAVGVGAYGIKAGAPIQPERMAKYTRLVEIEREMVTSG
ncbi:MAG: hypothetical protein ABIG87_00275 [Patescibacteria group bacterium]